MFNILNFNNRDSQDQIDQELSKTYFGNIFKDESFQDMPATEVSFTHPSRIKPLLIITAAIIGIVSLIFASFYFFSHKRFTFVVNINVENIAPALAVLTEEKNITPAPIEFPKKEVSELAVPKIIFKNVLTFYDFEEDNQNWEIPDWEFKKTLHPAMSLKRTGKMASKGHSSLELSLVFKKDNCSAAYIETERYVNLEHNDVIRIDLYVPPDAPKRLRAKFVLTTGENWQFMEMARGKRLIPGTWTTLTANISEKSIDWQSAHIDKHFKTDIRKIALKIESFHLAYSGPIYVDNIRVASIDKTNTIF